MKDKFPIAGWGLKIPIKDDDKIKCDICEKELWMLNSKSIRDQEDEIYIVCGTCYQDCRDEQMHTI